MTRALALTLAIATSGCSFAFVKKPPTTEVEPVRWPRCTDHRFWSLADAAITAVALGGLIYFSKQDDSTAALGAVVEGGIALGFGISAISGLGKVQRCKDQRAAYEKAADEGR